MRFFNVNDPSAMGEKSVLIDGVLFPEKSGVVAA